MATVNTLTELEKRKLIDAAIEALGAAILAENGKIYTGANVENASYGMTICAERSAAVKAVNEGNRKFMAVACVGGSDELLYCSPCGACRQFLFEFNADTEILGLDKNEIVSNALSELLPKAFGPANLS